MRDKFDHARGWFRKAESDLTTGRRTLASDGPYDTACFHAQQAAEKYLKGFLAFLEALQIPQTHNLEDLLNLCVALVPGWGIVGVDLTELTPYAVQLRYDFEFWPDPETAEKALNMAEQVRAAVLSVIPQKAHP
ncbi:MAG: HEPN domain-containing protein [Candidatus Latescibacteria bacterium]|nr:HEPN domain-containing protein [Candidatus Latescibacterota bacterium]